MGGEGFQIVGIGGQHRPVWLGKRDDKRVDGRPATGEPPQERRSAREGLRNGFRDVAGLE
jgi:hypothetical protein